jgi:FKBP-type peptidyl-prolyl cis-trans isomerase
MAFMNSKFSSLVTLVLVILVGTALVIPQASAQEPVQQIQPQAPPQTTLAATNSLPAATNALPKHNPNEITLYNGVKMEVMRAADGPKPEPHAIVQIQYIGHLEDGTEFDRSYSRRYPSIYRLSDVIGCWQTGIPEMNVGSKVKFTCPPGSANGKRPVDFIWGDTTLYFVIELIAIVG